MDPYSRVGFPFDAQADPINLTFLSFLHTTPRLHIGYHLVRTHCASPAPLQACCDPSYFRMPHFWLQLKAPHISVAFVQSNFPFWFWQHMDQIWASLMIGNTLVGILLLLFLVSRGN